MPDGGESRIDRHHEMRCAMADPKTRDAHVRSRTDDRAEIFNAEAALRRAVLADPVEGALFHQVEVTLEQPVAALVPQVDAPAVAALAIEARECIRSGYVPLLLVREMARHASHRALVAATLVRVIQRADEISSFVAIYWSDGRQPLSAQVKKGLAAAFTKFDGDELARSDREGTVRLRDVLFLCHARPRDITQEVLWKQFAEDTLPAQMH